MWEIVSHAGRHIRGHIRGHRGGTFLAALSIFAFGVTACSSARPTAASSAQPRPGTPGHPAVARTHTPSSPTVVLTGSSADELAAGVARQLFLSAPIVVVSADDPVAVNAAAADARRLSAPLLLTAPGPPRSAHAPASASAPVPGPPGPRPSPGLPPSAEPPSAAPPSARALPPPGTISPVLRAEITSLHPRDVLAVGLPARVLSAWLPGVHVVSGPGALPVTAPPPPLSHVAVLVPPGASAATVAITETAQIAGASVVPVPGDDPRTDSTAITALSAAKPVNVVAAGAGFGPPSLLAYRVAVAATGVQLPGGGQILFPGHRLVALYGHPEAPVLGALGQQDLPASIARARQMAAPYRALSGVPVIPAFEIIATVALGFPGPDGTYSGVSSVASLRPWVERASAAGFYVVLDLQPGRASLLAQAKMYKPLLAMPNVGLALDGEWKLQPHQLPLRQIGSISIREVNSVVRWLAGLTAELHLPQKLLVLHQFQLSMIQDERGLDTGNADLAIVVHMDGQGTQGMKQDTWSAVTAAAPHGVFFGWKNFLTKDHPMLNPRGTMAKAPAPVMISYQ
jgi:hypothetical protein